MKRIWKAKPNYSNDLLTQLLSCRGVFDASEIVNFLEPKYENCQDPFLLSDMDKTVSRIKEALEKQEKITIYADYDADAVTAATVLLRFFQKIDYPNVDYYIPDRFAEGYGINLEAVKLLAERGTRLLLTVDCGINAVEAVELANYLGVDVIVTDHHLPHIELPRAVAVVNPHRVDDQYPFKDLTGVGVAFKLVQALIKGEGVIIPGWEKWLLDLVAIGTVADCQSLVGENRILVKWGLQVLKKTRWIGLSKLLEIAGILEDEPDTYKIGFIIAPRINAAGRIEHASLALELLLTDDERQAQRLAQKLDDLNRHRQKLTEQILSEAREQILRNSDRKVLMAWGASWPKGIVGLVAGRLAEEFYRPVLVLSHEEEEAVGSARSIASFNIVKALDKTRELLTRFGGHEQAAGFTLKTQNIETFYQNLLEYAEAVLEEEDLSPVLWYDAEISLGEVTDELVALLEKFAPFGVGNFKPRFRMRNLLPRYVMPVGGEGNHLRLVVEAEGRSIGCIGFNLGFWAEKLQDGGLIDLICEPQFNLWNGERKIQLKIIDLIHSFPSPSEGRD